MYTIEKNYIYNNFMSREQKIVKMLGYELIEEKQNLSYKIVDKEGTEVGFSKNLLNDPYYTENFSIYINSNDVFCDMNLDYDKIFGNMYFMNIKRENGDVDKLEIKFNNGHPSLTLSSKKYGNIEFSLDSEGLLNFKFKSKLENFDVFEKVSYKVSAPGHMIYDDEYSYEISYLDESQGKVITKKIFYHCDDSEKTKGKITLHEFTFEDWRKKEESISYINGNIEEIVSKHYIGIDAFKRFRYLINDILPFNEDIIYTILKNYPFEDKNLSLFIPDIYEKRKKKTIYLKNKN